MWGRVQTTAHRLTGADAADPRQREARTHEEVMKDVVGSGTTPGDPDRGAARVSLCLWLADAVSVTCVGENRRRCGRWSGGRYLGESWPRPVG